uniref:Uncharacterized protein n=1 Tax=Cucumis melo TaxID=3656 RepID=A0A9I9D832_CUCME
MDVDKSVVRDASSRAFPTRKRDDVDKELLSTHCSPIWTTHRQWRTTDIC